MYVAKRTWIEYGPRRRGLGLAPCPSAQQLAGVADASDPCQAPPATQCNPLTGLDVNTGLVCGNIVLSPGTLPPGAAADSASVCFAPLFPWIGQRFAGTCVPAFAVPSPWNLVVTAGVIGLVLFKFRGR